MLRDDSEDARGQSHVEEPVRLFPALLDTFKVLVELQERIVPVILARDVGTERAEILQLLLDILGGCLDVGSDSPDVFVVVHLSPSISDNLDILGQELIPILYIPS